MTATRDQLVEAGARALESEWRVRHDEDCEMYNDDEHASCLCASRTAQCVLDAVLPLITPPDALCGPVAAQTPETAPTGTRPHSDPFSNV